MLIRCWPPYSSVPTGELVVSASIARFCLGKPIPSTVTNWMSCPKVTRSFVASRNAASSPVHTIFGPAFHPDQFVVLNSPRPEVVEASIRELEYQTEVAEWVGADVVNIHGGGAYGDKKTALDDFARNLKLLSRRLRSRLTVENDDKTYTPADLLPMCRAEGIPFVYDVHHHRCNRDSLSEAEATDRAVATWDREPLFHVSSPIEGWHGSRPERHHDFVDVQDFPECWRGLEITVEVEAKAKEVAVLKLMKALQQREARTAKQSR